MPPTPTSFNSQALSNALTITFGIAATLAAVAGVVLAIRQYRQASASPVHASPTTHATQPVELGTHSSSAESIVTVHQPVLPPPVYVAEHGSRHPSPWMVERTTGDGP
ncbi:hypothetical protein LTR56_007298 [Elasticomyces elasticus]|nr:hypothetical protein LTR56_007298 [Elasticomyces elasticus]KAK4918913.1 hypothetical protein LTR49_013385 [Elasticomyces elasticus]KAK5753797.1 hypothetical protein LTS12_016106 [Elasticomyces elasticus]